MTPPPTTWTRSEALVVGAGGERPVSEQIHVILRRAAARPRGPGRPRG